MSIAE
jgi:5-oxoprolinase (ATP-hydrolysing)